MEISRLEEILSNIYKAPARIAVLGVGNSLRSDDYVGVILVQKLKKKIKKDSVLFVEAEIAPTNFFHVIQEWNPTHLLIIDAADFEGNPGDFNLIEREQMATFSLTSHKRALSLLIDLLSHYLPHLKILILGIQPASVEFHSELNLSKVVNDTIQKLMKVLVTLLSRV